MAHEHKALIEKFYTSFASADAEGMVSCYHNNIRFSDPAFGVLHGADAKKMWHMLVRPGILITFSNVQADEHSGSADWVAEYDFGKSRRHVVNRIHAQFEFEDGKIITHTDTFDLWKWSRQALGLPGMLFGWTSWMQQKVRSQTNSKLNAFQG